MASLNKVQLIGFTGGEPRITTFTNGSKTATVSLATKERAYITKSGAEVPEKTDWHNIVAYNQLAEIFEKYVHKGSLLYVEGKLRTRSYEKNGTTHYITEVIIDTMQIIDRQQQAENVNESNW